MDGFLLSFIECMWSNAGLNLWMYFSFGSGQPRVSIQGYMELISVTRLSCKAVKWMWITSAFIFFLNDHCLVMTFKHRWFEKSALHFETISRELICNHFESWLSLSNLSKKPKYSFVPASPTWWFAIYLSFIPLHIECLCLFSNILLLKQQ